MGFGDFMTSSSSATDARIAATDQARVNRGNVGQSVESRAVGLTGKSTLLGAGSTQNNIKAAKGSNVTIQNMDAQVAQQAMADAIVRGA